MTVLEFKQQVSIEQLFKEFWKPWKGWQPREKAAAKALFIKLSTTGMELKIEGFTTFYKPSPQQLIFSSAKFIEADSGKPDADPQYTPRARKWLRNAMWEDYDIEEARAEAEENLRRARRLHESRPDETTREYVELYENLCRELT